jgi:S1-C subfamily serine protease
MMITGGSMVKGLLVLALSALLACYSQAAALPDVLDQIRGGIVGVGKMYPPRSPLPAGAQRMTFRGTGFAVADGLHVITNAHVLPDEVDEDHMEVLAVYSGRGNASKAHPARVLAVDKAHDLALLAIAPPALSPLALGNTRDVREGEDIAITGFPIGVVLGLYPVTHRGIVAAITPMAKPAENARELSGAHMARMRSGDESFQLDIVAYPGNSGSPAYEPATGRVVGVLNSVMVKETRESLLQSPSGISYAIPVSHVKKLLKAQGL